MYKHYPGVPTVRSCHFDCHCRVTVVLIIFVNFDYPKASKPMLETKHYTIKRKDSLFFTFTTSRLGIGIISGLAMTSSTRIWAPCRWCMICTIIMLVCVTRIDYACINVNTTFRNCSIPFSQITRRFKMFNVITRTTIYSSNTSMLTIFVRIINFTISNRKWITNISLNKQIMMMEDFILADYNKILKIMIENNHMSMLVIMENF